MLQHYKGQLGEFDYNTDDYDLINDFGDDCLHYKGETLKLNLPKGITSTRGMFEGCRLPEGFTFGDFNTENVTDMTNMFRLCQMPVSFTLGNQFDTTSVQKMSGMFMGCTMSDDFSLGDKFDTSNVEKMQAMAL